MILSWDKLRLYLPMREGRSFVFVTIAGIAIAVAALFVTLSIIDGFIDVYRAGLLRFNSPIMIMRADEQVDAERVQAALAPYSVAQEARPAEQRRVRQHTWLESYWLLANRVAYRVADWCESWPALADRVLDLVPLHFVNEHAAPAWLKVRARTYGQDIRAQLERGVTNAVPFLYREAMLLGGGAMRGVALRGMPPADLLASLGAAVDSDYADYDLETRLTAYDAAIPVLVGAAVFEEGMPAHAQLYMPRDKVTGDYLPLNIVGTVRTGVHELDSQFLYMSLEHLRRISGAERAAMTGYEVGVDDLRKAPRLAQLLGGELGPAYEVSDWQQRNAQTFQALELEKMLFGLIMGILVVIAVCNIVATSLINILQRYQSIAVLRALGLSERQVRRLLCAQGMVIGGTGVLAGLCLGTVIAWSLAQFNLIDVDPSIYFVSQVPASLHWSLYLGVGGSALLLSMWAVRRAVRKLADLPIMQALGRGYL